MGQKREPRCDCGNLFVKPGASSKPRRQPAKRSEPKRIWDDANAKVELEARCRICGWEGNGLERAHIMGRKYDQPAHTGTRTLYVNPLDIVPLCPAFAPEECHRRVDAHELDGPREAQMGNAVTVPVAEWIGKHILDYEEGNLT